MTVVNTVVCKIFDKRLILKMDSTTFYKFFRIIISSVTYISNDP